MIRELEFLQGMTVTLLSDRRTHAPYGMAGGNPGQPGINTLFRDGHITNLPGKVTLEVHAGDRLRIETPGGGGYGTTDSA